MTDNRQSQRLDIELPGKFCFKEQPNTWIDVDVMNISISGFCFRASIKHVEQLKQKPVIRLGFALNDDEDVLLDIQVVWAGRTGNANCMVGGEIVDPSGVDYQKIAEFYARIICNR